MPAELKKLAPAELCHLVATCRKLSKPCGYMKLGNCFAYGRNALRMLDHLWARLPIEDLDIRKASLLMEWQGSDETA